MVHSPVVLSIVLERQSSFYELPQFGSTIHLDRLVNRNEFAAI